MKKMLLMLLFGVFMISCGKNAVPAFADMGNLAEEIYRKAGWDVKGVYTEAVDESFAFAFGISADEFDDRVETAICLRETVDSKGRALYVFEADEEKDALWLAQKIYGSYEFAPCDAAEKMTVACSGKYVMLFKSNATEVENAAQGFRTLVGGSLRFKKDRTNPS
ncbi:MAG: hypothetical protein IJA86_03190 [Clostridia bacterium]|nr:hypothetical protein [Clostridia bacterium]